MAKSTKKYVGKDVMDLEGQSLAKRFERIKSRAAFAKQHGLNATMIQQHLTSERPISLDYAKAYAKAFGCDLIDISKRLYDEILKANIFIKNEISKEDNQGSLISQHSELTKQEIELLTGFRKIKTEEGVKNILNQLEMVIATQTKSAGSSAADKIQKKQTNQKNQ